MKAPLFSVITRPGQSVAEAYEAALEAWSMQFCGMCDGHGNAPPDGYCRHCAGTGKNPWLDAEPTGFAAIHDYD